MITTSDFICKLLSDRKLTIPVFCHNANIKERAFYYAIEKNSWTKPMLEQISDALGENLTFLANSSVGR